MGNQSTKVNSVTKNNNKYEDQHEKKSRTNWTAGKTYFGRKKFMLTE